MVQYSANSAHPSVKPFEAGQERLGQHLGRAHHRAAALVGEQRHTAIGQHHLELVGDDAVKREAVTAQQHH